MNKSNTYNGFRSNISFFIHEEVLQTKYFCVFCILAIEEIVKIMENVNKYKGERKCQETETEKEGARREIDIGLSEGGRGY